MTQRSSVVTDSHREIMSPNAAEELSNKRLKHWEGSQTKLAFIKKELKRNERSKLVLKEQALAENYPDVILSKTKYAGNSGEMEVAIKTKAKAQVVEGQQNRTLA